MSADGTGQEQSTHNNAGNGAATKATVAVSISVVAPYVPAPARRWFKKWRNEYVTAAPPLPLRHHYDVTVLARCDNRPLRGDDPRSGCHAPASWT